MNRVTSTRGYEPERLHAGTLPRVPQMTGDQLSLLRELAQEPHVLKFFQYESARPLPAGLVQRREFMRAGLIDAARRPCFRLNLLRGQPFVTDGPWNSGAARVYAYSDESEQLLGYIDEVGLASFDSVIEIGAGCGHTILTIDARTRIGIDVNPRARSFLELNAKLNHVKCKSVTVDILQQGLPVELLRHTGSCLFLANLPFALTPRGVSLPVSVAGGPTGLDPTLAALAAIERAVRSSGIAARLVMLCNSLGDGSRWQIVDAVAQTAPEADVRWRVLPGARIWRVNGKPRYQSPMRIAHRLRAKAYARPLSSDGKAVHRYATLEDKLLREGWTHLARGVADITF